MGSSACLFTFLDFSVLFCANSEQGKGIWRYWCVFEAPAYFFPSLEGEYMSVPHLRGYEVYFLCVYKHGAAIDLQARKFHIQAVIFWIFEVVQILFSSRFASLLLPRITLRRNDVVQRLWSQALPSDVQKCSTTVWEARHSVGARWLRTARQSRAAAAAERTRSSRGKAITIAAD